jgi:hypothetical protein
MSNFNFNPEHLGGGTVIFKNAINIPQKEAFEYLDKKKDEAFSHSYTIVKDEDGNSLHAINKGGFIYDLEDMDKAPIRIGSLDIPFFQECEKAIYGALLHYVEMFPAVLQCLWWKSPGHVLRYAKGGGLGFHADNDVNYRYGREPKEQHATRNVLSALVYFNDCTDDESVEYSFSGGTMTIPYFDIDIAPSTGAIVLMPANYIGAHQINEVTRGVRYSYLTWFAQGSQDDERGCSPAHPEETMFQNNGQWWLPSIIKDYENHLIEKYGSVSNAPQEKVDYLSRANDH